ncbi:MAG: divergent polysaccharide deacetylase family protein [Emcibacter sp.]|nr:divergent polysaccharide deacetylase family protein [Emcibacter sp.]
MSLAYLFLIGMAFGAIWIFHDSHSKIAPTQNILAFEEEHKIVEVVIADVKTPYVALEIPAESFLPEPIEETWQTHAVKVSAVVEGKPQISIIIDDLGVVRSRTFDVITLAPPLTLSFLPYAPDLYDVTRIARDKGHELMVHIPMEPKGDKDPGPHALLTHSTDQKILQDLQFNLSRFDGYVGLNNHMGSAFTEDRAGLNLVLDEVQKRGLLVLDSRTSGKSLFAQMAEERNIPNMTRDLFLDNEQDVDYIIGQLEKLENMARRRGTAIAIGHPYKETIKALSIWLPTLKAKGIAVVPLSHLIKRKYENIQLAKR